MRFINQYRVKRSKYGHLNVQNCIYSNLYLFYHKYNLLNYLKIENTSLKPKKRVEKL